MALENVWMIKFFKGINLALKHFFLRLALDTLDVNDFDCNGLFIGLVDTSVDDRTKTFTNDVFETVGVIFDFFSEIIIGIELAIHCS